MKSVSVCSGAAGTHARLRTGALQMSGCEADFPPLLWLKPMSNMIQAG